jgi:hypothetical protein
LPSCTACRQSPRPIEFRIGCGQEIGTAALGDLRMLHRRRLDPIATAQVRGQGRLGRRKTLRDKRSYPPRKRAGLLLDIDDAQRALAPGLARQPLAEPAIDRLQAAHWVAGRWITSIE